MGTNGLGRAAALSAISFYQKFLSPHKGFTCAYGAHTGRASCSSLGYRAIELHGLVVGFAILRKRTYLCGVAFRRFAKPRNPVLWRQRGICDVGCDLPCHGGCELPSLDGTLEALSCVDPSCCDWRDRKKKPEQEQNVYIPPKPHSEQEGSNA
jgi:uncharacterized protein